MDNKDLRQETVSSMIWNAFQRFGTMSISFISNIVLARILVPDDFGCIGMLSIFIVLSEVFIDGGFGSALIQKKEVNQVDYSTIFYWNLFIAVCLYVVLFITAPFIAVFYNMPNLQSILQVVSIVLIINGFSVIHTTILTKQLKFKLIAKVNLIASVIGLVASIVAALFGLGVWSLVIKTILSGLIVAVLLWKYNEWRPLFIFSWDSLQSLFSFGGLMLLSRLLNTLFENLQGLVIGKFFTARDLGFYSQARRLDEIPSVSISKIVTNVSFPVFSKISDIDSLRNAVQKNILCTTYLLFPLEILLIVVADSLIVFLFSDKWIESIPYFRILCIYSMFVSLNAINTNVYIAMGKSGLYFWIQLIKKVLGIALIWVGLQFGVIGIAWSLSITGILWWVIAAIANGKILNYGFIRQSLDVLPSFCISICVGILTFLLSQCLPDWSLAKLVILTIEYVCSFITLSYLFKLSPLFVYTSIFVSYLKRMKCYDVIRKIYK